jgi:gamma-polyglutamate biosynthesis protein CapA
MFQWRSTYKHAMSIVFICLCMFAVQGDAQESENQNLPSSSPESVPLRIFLGGDVMVGRYVKGKLRLHGGDRPFKVIGDLAPKEHLTMINLETPISDKVSPLISRSKDPSALKVVFRLPTRFASQLANSGVNVAVLANNHSEDCGQESIQTTVNTLESVGIRPIGAHHRDDPFAPLLMDHNGHQVAVLAATILRNMPRPRSSKRESLAFYEWKTVKNKLRDAVQATRKKHPNRVLVVSLHWGNEFALDVSGWSRRIARGLIDAGANIVWGHHSHTFQPIEVYQDGLILYGTGNLVFDMFGAKSRRSGLVETHLFKTSGGKYQINGFTVHGVTLLGVRDPARPSKPMEIKSTLQRLAKTFKSDVSPKTLRLEGSTLNWRR